MNSLFKTSRKRILFLSFIFVLIIVVLTNVGVQIVNEYYRNVIIDQENTEFIELFTHLVEFSSEEDAFTVAEHYSHTNNAAIEIYKDNEIIFNNNRTFIDRMTYVSVANEAEYKFVIDNTNSYVAVVRDSEVFYINIIVFTVFALLLSYFLVSRYRRNQKTVHDIREIQVLLEKRKSSPHFLFFEEFHRIYHDILDNINTIDLLNQKKSDNLSGLVHDLKTPITIIKYHLEEDDILENKDAIIQSLNDLTSLASDLVSENFQGEHKKINMSVLLRNQVEIYKKTFASKNIEIKSVILDDIFVKFNKRDLTRVIQNLMTNAFYYSYENTVVTVHLIHSKDTYNLEISNKGEMLDKNVIEDIFSKRITKQDTETGNGFGLYITKLLVEDAGANIKVQSSKDINKFIIEFPK